MFSRSLSHSEGAYSYVHFPLSGRHGTRIQVQISIPERFPRRNVRGPWRECSGWRGGAGSGESDGHEYVDQASAAGNYRVAARIGNSSTIWSTSVSQFPRTQNIFVFRSFNILMTSSAHTSGDHFCPWYKNIAQKQQAVRLFRSNASSIFRQ